MTRSAKRFFVALMVGTMIVLAMVLFPVGPALLLAAVVAVLLWPLQQWLAVKLRGRRSLAAGLLVFGVTVLIIAPIVGLSAFVVGQVTQGIRFVVETLESEGVQGLIQELPAPLRAVAREVREHLPRAVTLERTLDRQGSAAASAVSGVVAATGSVLLQTALMLIGLFFFLVRGADCVEWLDDALPLRRGQTHELLLEVKRVGHSVVVSNFVTAGAQAAAAMVGYLIARVPFPLFFGAITFVSALIPAVGGAVVVICAAAILWLTGHAWWALFLALWGLVVVGLVDNVLRPLLIRGRAELDGAVVFFSLIGGVLAFGTVGLLIGPLVVSLFLATLRIYHRDVAPPRQVPSLQGKRRSAAMETTADADTRSSSVSPAASTRDWE